MTETTRQILECRRPENRHAFTEGTTGRHLTWEDVARRADSWQARELEPGTRIGLHLADPLAAAAHLLAALATGTTVAPLNPCGAPSELAAQVAAAGLAGVVTDTGDPAVTAALSAAGAASLASEDTTWRLPEVRPVDGPPAALVMASSGTTGVPKLIPLTEEQLLQTARGVAAHLGLDDTQRGFSPLPLFHINGLVVGVLAALVGGSSLVVDRRFSLRSFWSVVEREEVTWLNLVPAILTVLGSGGGGPAPARVRLARSASAPLAAATRERFEGRFAIPVIETYGMTEAASQITANPVNGTRPASVGIPVGVELRVVDGGRSPLTPGGTGAIEIRGASVTTSYWTPAGPGRPVPEVVPATRLDGWLMTGDIGHVDEDGYVYLTGRADDVINRSGEIVQPREIEEVILGDPRVSVAVVVGRPHPTLGEEPVAYVLPAAGADHERLARDLTSTCAAALSDFKRPAEIVVANALPSGPTGKVRRAEVREMAAATAAR